MQTRLSADTRRAQLVSAALDRAERVGIEALTVRGVADEAGVSQGAVYYLFESKESLVIAMGEGLVVDVTRALQAAFTDSVNLPGVPGLRELVHSGLSAIWPIVEKTADRQLLSYEIKTYLLRHRALGSELAASIATGQYRIRDDETLLFFQRCSEFTGTRWIEPIEAVARFGMATVDGLILRWLVDHDDVAVIAALDDLSGIIASKAVEV
ncbi:helix-turn-helix transcriptional regulator [Rhodococcus sp. BP-252]|uniref:TetR family transcriptional regulator n=1 Tax=Rhodococcoides kyotonense TaxID=398843 RepID=A0A177YCJ5_9NOCA|nr:MULTISPECIES: helix-turn-helix domain-containing protein [Rhodococcus]MBY6411566.1 helix-turn-helix transcriptional regulator [Rhodococcus sp. BP-320]MBY6417948.1 helix-turn-helix transcriptional regulator [Rhodococcus sp. BP-321]MBY6422151.1 helix-turn-helix transcriptional regulator [Rhodococcus sp. BP-324]MBY6427746.1 helix-turn-helix transcriptional regulator [Rhodococcus sp. BP-323]MBY6433035.1 helix-turn-helix transcriptional regulator [Rhodococcus sp. BP-322]